MCFRYRTSSFISYSIVAQLDIKIVCLIKHIPIWSSRITNQIDNLMMPLNLCDVCSFRTKVACNECLNWYITGVSPSSRVNVHTWQWLRLRLFERSGSLLLYIYIKEFLHYIYAYITLCYLFVKINITFMRYKLTISTELRGCGNLLCVKFEKFVRL